MQSNRIIQVEEKVPPRLLVPLSIQHMFAMFGASVLVPFIFHMNPAIVLFMNGIGTLLFILITKGKAPAYLGSSFAFIAPATIVIQNWGYQYALGGFVVVGACGCVLAFIIYKCGTDWINVVLPPAAMGPVVALIGLELAGSAASTGCIVGDSVTTGTVVTFLVTLAVAVFGSVLFRGFFSTIPILIAIICGYIAGVLTGVIETQTIVDALHTSFISIPNFQTPKFDINAILIILPVILVIANEHIGHQLVTGKVIGRDLLKDPGLHRSLFADNFSTMISGFIGSVPTTTYGENIGVMAITKVYSVRVIGGAAVLSIICSFVGPLAALIQTIPGPVIGGISFLLYGMIGMLGVRIWVQNRVDFSNPVNLNTAAVALIVAIANFTWTIGTISFEGIALGTAAALLIYHSMHFISKLCGTNLEAATPASAPSGSELEGEAYSKRHRSPAPQADA